MSFLGDHGAIFSHVVPEATKATTVGKVTAINTMPAPVSKSPNGRSSSGGGGRAAVHHSSRAVPGRRPPKGVLTGGYIMNRSPEFANS